MKWRGTVTIIKQYEQVEVDADNEEEATAKLSTLTDTELSNYSCDENAEVDEVECIEGCREEDNED